jgi:L-alanine-DL-glutamate epimerase-like enolase superfamily enzyme
LIDREIDRLVAVAHPMCRRSRRVYPRVIEPAVRPRDVDGEAASCAQPPNLTVPSESPPLVEFIPWTQQVFENPSIVHDGFVERPQAPGASTTITEQARQNWQIKGVGTTTTQD